MSGASATEAATPPASRSSRSLGVPGALRTAWARIPGALIALILAAGLTALLWTAGTYRLTTDSAGFRGTGDDHVYLYMTAHPVGSFHIAPWCWRILVPAVVRYLPVGPQAGYSAIALATVALTGVLVYLILRKWGFADGLALGGLLLYFSFGYVTKFNLKDFWLTDSTAFFFASAAILALQYRRRFLFALCLLLGVLAKESVIFVAPLYYTFSARRRWDPGALGAAAALAAPALAALIALRVAVPAWNSVPSYVASLPASVRSDIGNLPSYNMLTVARQTISARGHDWPRTTLAYVFCCFGLLGLVLPLAAALPSRMTGPPSPLTGPPSRLREVLLRFWPLLVLDLAQLLFALNTQRLVVFAFLPVIMACLCGVQAAMARGAHGAWFAVLAVTAIILEFADRDQSSPLPLHQTIVLGGLCLLAVAVTLVRTRRGRSRPARELRLTASGSCAVPAVSTAGTAQLRGGRTSRSHPAPAAQVSAPAPASSRTASSRTAPSRTAPSRTASSRTAPSRPSPPAAPPALSPVAMPNSSA